MLKSINGIFWRTVAVRYDPLSTKGAEINGGRWNFPGEGALYLAGSEDCSLREVQRRIEKVLSGIKTGNFKIVSIGLNLSRLLDLTDKRIRRRLGVKLWEIRSESHKLCRRYARRWKRKYRLQGLLYPSFVDQKCTNLVIFSPLPPGIKILEKRQISLGKM